MLLWKRSAISFSCSESASGNPQRDFVVLERSPLSPFFNRPGKVLYILPLSVAKPRMPVLASTLGMEGTEPGEEFGYPG